MYTYVANIMQAQKHYGFSEWKKIQYGWGTLRILQRVYELFMNNIYTSVNNYIIVSGNTV